jgi:hypothetical protein
MSQTRWEVGYGVAKAEIVGRSGSIDRGCREMDLLEKQRVGSAGDGEERRWRWRGEERGGEEREGGGMEMERWTWMNDDGLIVASHCRSRPNPINFGQAAKHAVL